MLTRRCAQLLILADLRSFLLLMAFLLLPFSPCSWAQTDLEPSALIEPSAFKEPSAHKKPSALNTNPSESKLKPEAVSIEKLLQVFVRNGSSQLFDGTFVYLFEDQVQAIRVHRSLNEEGVIVEEFVPQDDKQENSSRLLSNQFCLLDNGWQYQFKALSSSFPFRVNNSFDELQKLYDFSIISSKKVAGSSAIGVDIQSKDPLRYGYQIWFDTETGTLLKYKLLNHEGKVIEQYLFTDIKYGPKSELHDKPHSKGEIIPCRKKFSGLSDAFKASFMQDKIPKGYQPISYRKGLIKESERQARQFQLSDGLSTVSIFIEDREQVNKKINGVIRIGPMSVAGKAIGQYQVTVIGAIPVDSALQFVNSIKP